MNTKQLLSFITKIGAIAIILVVPSLVLAQTTGGLAGLAEGLRKQIVAVADVLTVVAYVAGVGFALAGIIQFKAHKDNPMQVPLSKPVVYLVVGGCLLFLPTILETAGGTLFGEGKGKEAITEKFSSKLK